MPYSVRRICTEYPLWERSVVGAVVGGPADAAVAGVAMSATAPMHSAMRDLMFTRPTCRRPRAVSIGRAATIPAWPLVPGSTPAG